jgi:hypothetical protein
LFENNVELKLVNKLNRIEVKIINIEFNLDNLKILEKNPIFSRFVLSFKTDRNEDIFGIRKKLERRIVSY